MQETKALYRGGYVLERDQTFWRRLVVDGSLDYNAVLSKGYRPAQIPYIESEMRKLGWLS